VIEEADATVKPRLLTIGAYRYPASLESAGVTGCVVLRYIVTEAGTADPRSIQVVRRSDPLFATAAIQMVRTARYAPGELNGRKVRVWVRQTVHYTDPTSGIAEAGCLRGP
jgi:TonB family protein